ncbi:hypothetical protein [Aureispira sp. CCB-E]|uniref:hypothetical protein n=1 Tax=Aureispira sp. CCB-E TaxID=3051121 RepID=UPI0028684384|nr:hypothetical protein [Aureispira sp. CCB-E]WMX16283.1 hypothetical protein QP953_07885 [Aureispira sp. CCB-E]
MSINLSFGDIQIADKHSYVSQKLTTFFKEDEVKELTEQVLDSHGKGAVPCASQAQIDSLQHLENEEVRIKKVCFIKKVDELFSLGKEEKIVEDRISFLTDDYLSYKKGTGVLTRKTNQATLYYFAPLIQFNGNQLIDVPSKSLLKLGEVSDEPKKTTASSLLVLFAEALIGAAGESIGGAIGTAIIETILGTSPGIDYAQLISDIKKIIKEANEEQTVQEQGGKVQSVSQRIRNYYIPRKASASKEELYDILEKYYDELSDVSKTLEQELFQKKGLPIFIQCETIKLCVLQEMALQDPDASTPYDSSILETIKLLLTGKNDNGSIAYIKERHQAMLKERLDQISAISNDYQDCRHGACTHYYAFDDYFTEIRYHDTAKSSAKKEEIIANLEAQRKQLEASLTEDMSWMTKIINNWEKLAKNPLPTC